MIKALLSTPQWAVAERVAQSLKDKLAYDSTVRDSEWDTLKATLIKHGQVEGIGMFVNELYKIALEK